MSKKNVWLTLRLTSEEYAAIQERCRENPQAKHRNGKENLSEYVREQLLAESNIKNKTLLMQNEELRYQVRKIGLNINQLTRKVNAGFGRASDMEVIQQYVTEMILLLDDYIKKVEEKWESQN